MVCRLRRLLHPADIDDGIALDDRLLYSFELADDQLRYVPGAFHGGILGPIWQDEDSHAPWAGVRDPRQKLLTEQGGLGSCLGEEVLIGGDKRC